MLYTSNIYVLRLDSKTFASSKECVSRKGLFVCLFVICLYKGFTSSNCSRAAHVRGQGPEAYAFKLVHLQNIQNIFYLLRHPPTFRQLNEYYIILAFSWLDQSQKIDSILAVRE